MANNTISVIFKAVDKVSGETRKIGRAIDSVGTAVVGLAGAYTALGVAAVKIGEQHAAIVTMGEGARMMAQQFGQSMDEVVVAMRRASNATVDDMTLMAAASRAMQLGVATTPEEFAKLTTASIALGRAMGRGPAEAIDDIVTGIGRMSPLILDNLGILTKGGGVFDDYAATMGKTADQLTDAEKKQALLNITMESAIPLLDSTGKLADTAATEYQQFAAESENLKNKLMLLGGEALLPLFRLFNDMLALRSDNWFRDGADAAADFINAVVAGKGKMEANAANLEDTGIKARFAANMTGGLAAAIRSIPTKVTTTTNLKLQVNGDEVDVATFIRLTTVGGRSMSRNLRLADEALGVAGLAGTQRPGLQGAMPIGSDTSDALTIKKLKDLG